METQRIIIPSLLALTPRVQVGRWRHSTKYTYTFHVTPLHTHECEQISFFDKDVGIELRTLMNSNKSISRKNCFDQIPFFAISKMVKNQFFELGKSLKLPKMQFHENFLFIYLIPQVFCLDFFKFSGPPLGYS